MKDEEGVAVLRELKSLGTRLGVEAASPPPPSLTSARCSGARHAVICVQGFHGGFDNWAGFVDRLLEGGGDQDVYRVVFPFPLRADVPTPWTANPHLDRCAGQLASLLSGALLDRYATISLVAHSLGGLVVQRAIVDDDALRERLGHVVLYGTPSDGLGVGGSGAPIRAPWRDLRPGSRFLSDLRTRWRERIGDGPPFSFRAVAGLTDSFVEPASSVGPFSEGQIELVPADHLQMVASPAGSALLSDLLAGVKREPGPMRSALRAYFRGERARALAALLPLADSLNEEFVGLLALLCDEFEGLEQALTVLQQAWRSPPARERQLGALAVQYKHRWLTGRADADRARAAELYEAGMALAERQENWAAVACHALDGAFLELMATHPHAIPSRPAEVLAERALAACRRAADARLDALRGEALLLLGRLREAVEAYATGVRAIRPGRDRDALYVQSIQVARRSSGEHGVLCVQRAFGVAT